MSSARTQTSRHPVPPAPSQAPSQAEPRPTPHPTPHPTSPAGSPGPCLAETLLAPEHPGVAVTFGGQGADWVGALRELVQESPQVAVLRERVTAAERLLAPVAQEIAPFCDTVFDPLGWAEKAGPADVRAAALSVPGVLLTQLATLDVLALEGLDLAGDGNLPAVGHSQGILGVAALAGRREAADPQAGWDSDVALLAIARLIGAAATAVAGRTGLAARGDEPPMLAVSGVDRAEVEALLAEPGAERTDLVVAAVNGPRRLVVSGPPAALRRFRRRVEQRAAADAAARAAKERGGRPFSADLEPLPVAVGFHHPALAPAVTLVREWAETCGLDAGLAGHLAHAICLDTVDWQEDLRDVTGPDTEWVVDLGPGRLSASMTARALRGRGVTVVPAATPEGRDLLFTPGAAVDRAPDWSVHAPRLLDVGGSTVVDTAFTRLTGSSPILLAGMTPTTVDPAIVAAAANAGHWAELAGGGQVTEELFHRNLARLEELLDEGRTARFNALLLDPYLWQLHLGGQRLVQKARAAGAPLDGVVVSAGIPEVDAAVDLVRELHEAGITHVAFKPGTVAQIRQVLQIARAVDTPIIVQVEGGVAGGHHSWEDLDELLLATYAELRAVPHVVLCVGGGIGTPARAADYLTGHWSVRYGEAPMPVDGVLVGTAAMATREATTAPGVKRLLVDTPGTDPAVDGGWVGAGRSAGGVTSGRSQLGADIHELDNAASRCGRLLDEVAGDAEAVAARKDEIVAAMARTCKPYFGDVAEMTYEQWLRRYAELTHPEDGWLDPTLAARFGALLDRAVARLHPATSGPVDRLPADEPSAAVDALLARFPEAATCRLHPADVPFFVEVCRRPGKPVPFVPVLDAEVRRWWRADSLWQAHDPRYDADGVIVIPGPVSVAGIETVDEPVAELLDRFESAVVDRLAKTGAAALPGASRTAVGAERSVLDAVAAAPDVVWAGRVVTNPLRRLADVPGWTLTRRDAREAVLEVPLSRGRLRLRVDVSGVQAGRLPVVTHDAAREAMTELLGLTGGGSLPEVVEGTAVLRVGLDRARLADHVAVTDPVRRRSAGAAAHADPEPGFVPDALVGLAWPAVFACIGPIEGLLDLLHLDHRVEVGPAAARLADRLAATGADTETELVVSATRAEPLRTAAGTVLAVDVRIEDAVTGDPVARLQERFLVRGRVGAAELAAPPPLAPDARPRERARLDRLTVTAPEDLRGFATVTGDHNPLHTDVAAARLAGFPGPVVHGMWLSAVGQRAAASAGAVHRARPVRRWQARWVAPVRPGAEVELTVERIGVRHGDTVLEVTARCEGTVVMVAEAVVAAPSTAYAFPGQGIQKPGMGLDARGRSAAARAVWDRADRHTREALGFSVLAVVRDNPTEIWADGERHVHPDGVLYLTQFTQVSMAVLAVAQVAELREAGVFVEDAIACGHSVGEYNALAAVTGILPLEALLEIVFRRGMAMHHLVPRDAAGRSNFRLAAIRPSQVDLADADVAALVARVSEDSGEFVQIVNYNLRGAQYAVAGTVAGLAALEREIEARRARTGGKKAFVLVPGVDVPFHSAQLRAGVDDFRRCLEGLLPPRVDAGLLVGRYVPNLVPRLFSLRREYVEEVADYVGSDLLRAVLADWDSASADPDRLARTLLVELLAWQFASPVRWIETQDLLFGDAEDGGLQVEQFVEVGVAHAPTLANLAAQTVRDLVAAPRVLNCSRDAALVMATDTPALEEEDGPDAADQGSGDLAAGAPAPAPVSAAPAAATSSPAVERPADLRFAASDAMQVLVALRAKVRPDQIAPVDTVDGICDGVSSRRNQLLVDLGAELGLGAIDGAAEAEWTSLTATVDRLARSYTAFGPVLTEAVGDQLRTVAAAAGARPHAVAERVRDVWGLGPGWVAHVSAALALGTRPGTSTRGGPLADGAVGADGAVDGDLATAVDRAVQAVAARHGVQVALPSSDAAATAVDATVVAELADAITGPDGVLASTARHLLSRLGLQQHDAEDPEDLDAELVRLVEQELGGDWVRAVTPVLDPRRAVLLDDRWASVREDLARAWAGDEAVQGRCFAGLDDAAAAQARWWLQRARREHRSELVSFYGRVLAEAEVRGEWCEETAVVTGAAPGSIAAAVVADLLRGGATVVATASRLDEERLAFFRDLYRDHASTGAALWVIPANLASYSDVDALVDWVCEPVAEVSAGQRRPVREALWPTLLFPFAAPSVHGSAAEVGPRAEVEARVLLWGVERLVTGFAARGAQTRLGRRLHVVLPGSPNRGRFGNDGAYGEAKAALDALTARWAVEPVWADRVSLVHALIGWVRGTALMRHNDPVADAVAAAGVRVFTADEMGRELLRLCRPDARRQAQEGPLVADLTGGLGEADLDLAGLAAEAQAQTAAPAATATTASTTTPNGPGEVPLQALTHPPGWRTSQPTMPWPDLEATPQDLVVIVGAGEVGPFGSARTRFEMEVEDRLSPAGVVELAWTTGLIVWEHEPVAGWHDAATGEPLTETEVVERFEDRVTAAVGIRRYRDDGAMVDNTAPLIATAVLEEDTSFVVRTESEARAIAAEDPQRTRIRPTEDGDWQVTRLAGSQVRVPRRFRLSRTVGAQVPDGFDPAVWGFGSLTETIDRLAAWNLVSTVDAFVSSGFSPAELLRWIHPTQLASTQGTGIGGMQSTRRMYVDALLGETPPNDVLQEALPNVVAAHAVQSYVGGYGPMVHPVAACATAAVSVEEGVDKIRLGKARVVVAGGFDDLGIEGIVGFASMSATADTAELLAKGISERRVCRPNDRRRGGFVEGQGGGTVILARGDVAAEMGLPVLGVVAYAGSFADGIHTSIPAPGIGALGAAVGGPRSPLATGLATLGLTADDVAVVSKHDTSTTANDPNESQVHERIAAALGRSSGAPLLVVSQKSLTGHAKGGAAAFQLIGLCQLLAAGVVPANRSLDCVDEVLADTEHLVWLRQPLATGPLRAGLVTSLGFGHVSALVALAHPGAFVAALPPDAREEWLSRATARLVAGETRRWQAMCGGTPLWTRPVDRRLPDAGSGRISAAEAAMLLDPSARLGEDDRYRECS